MNIAKEETNKPVIDGFAQRIRESRRKINLSQNDLAKAIGVHSIHISRYERGISKPNTDTLMKLSDVLGVTADYLIDGNIENAAKAKFEDRELLQMFREIERLPEEEKIFIKKIIDAVLSKKKIQDIVR